MYAHHEASIQNLIAYFKGGEGIIALFLGGSVAKGCERPDSDLDALVIVTKEQFAVLESAGRLAETIRGHCTYESGYFDVKYMTKDYLRTAAEHGSEPARNAFLSARCLFSEDPECTELAARIPVFQKGEQEEKLLSFYAALSLNAGYLWKMSYEEPYLRARATADLVLFGLRLVLEARAVLFPCHKALLATVDKVHGGARCRTAAEALLREGTDENKKAFVQIMLEESGYTPPKDYAKVLTRFVDDNELWWYKNRPVITEW